MNICIMFCYVILLNYFIYVLLYEFVYIHQFAKHSYKTNGVDAAEEENKAIITFFIKNLFNKAIRRGIAGAKNIRTLADAFKSVQHNLLKLKRYEGLHYDSNDEEALEEGNEEVSIIRGRKGFATSNSNASEHDRVPTGFEIAEQIVDLPVTEIEMTNEGNKSNNLLKQDKQIYSFWGTCSNCRRFGHKYLHCGKYSCGCNTQPNEQKTINSNFKQHPSQYLQQFAVSPSLQSVPISPNIQIQPDGTALLIQQLVNATKVSQTAFEKTAENLNKIAEGMKMIKQQNEEIANVNKRIYNKKKSMIKI